MTIQEWLFRNGYSGMAIQEQVYHVLPLCRVQCWLAASIDVTILPRHGHAWWRLLMQMSACQLELCQLQVLQGCVSFPAMIDSNIDLQHVAKATSLCRGRWICSDDGRLHAWVCINNYALSTTTV